MNQTINLQSFTKLPLKHIHKADSTADDVIVETPHNGPVIINTKEMRYSMFSSTQVEKTAQQLIGELYKLEEEARSFLLANWLADHKNNLKI